MRIIPPVLRPPLHPAAGPLSARDRAPRHLWLLGFLLAIALGCQPASPGKGEEKPEVRHRRLCELENEEVTESSGLALSRRSPEVFWTHNDSGGAARIFAFDATGRDLAVFRITGTRAVDWEDMSSAQIEGKPHLIIADTGDNARERRTYRLIVVEEPAVDTAGTGRRARIEPTQILPFRFEDGPRNCEAVAWIPGTRSVLLATKHKLFRSDVYRLDLPSQSLSTPLTARRIARLPIPAVTAMDISPDGRHLVLLTYGPASEFTRKEKETWSERLKGRPRVIEMPERDQGEAIAYGPRGRKMYVTSEGSPMPLWEVQLRR